jgi:hypothetical protein
MAQLLQKKDTSIDFAINVFWEKKVVCRAQREKQRNAIERDIWEGESASVQRRWGVQA